MKTKNLIIIGTDMIAIYAKEIKNSLLSSAGFEVEYTSDDKPSTRTDVADNLAAMIYIRPKGALFYISRGNLASEDI